MMVQELITYLIVGIALVVAFRKIYLKLTGRKARKKTNAGPTMAVKRSMCADCPADCALRDSIASRENDQASCVKSATRR
ncbi:MAG: hypothetical protein WCY58_07630 [Mariniphaga sp.]|nr:hypothetical protein [Mariniphaga sp.]